PPAPVVGMSRVGMSRVEMNGRAPEASRIPDVLLPAQLPRAHGLLPSQRLMLAVLDDAIGEYRRLGQGMGRRALRLFGELTAWFESDDRTSTFSFQNICQTFGLEVEPVRAVLRTWPRPKPRPRRAALRVAPAPPPPASAEAELPLAHTG